MSMTMDDSIKRWTAKRKAALVIEIIQGIWEGPWPQWGRVSPDKDGGGGEPVLRPVALRD